MGTTTRRGQRAVKRIGQSLILGGCLLGIAACGSGTTVNHRAISHTIQRMLSNAFPTISFKEIPQGQSPSASVTDTLIRQEKKLLSSICQPNSPAWRKALAHYQSALSRASFTRTLHVQMSQFHLVSVTQNGNNASAEWTARVGYQTASINRLGHHWTYTQHRRRVEGTTVLKHLDAGWRISSTVGTAPP